MEKYLYRDVDIHLSIGHWPVIPSLKIDLHLTRDVANPEWKLVLVVVPDIEGDPIRIDSTRVATRRPDGGPAHVDSPLASAIWTEAARFVEEHQGEIVEHFIRAQMAA